MQGSNLLLADELFLTAHDDDGKALLSERMLGLGLAAAILGELVFFRRVNIQSGLLSVVDRRPLSEPLGASVLYQLLRESSHGNVRGWISYLAKTAEDTVGRRLVHHGHVRRTPIATLRIGNDSAGFTQLLAAIAELAPGPRVVVSLEGSRSYGIGLARALTAAGLLVIECEQPARRQRCGKGKSVWGATSACGCEQR